jgi:subtilisin-like proprotein convertase family protein
MDVRLAATRPARLAWALIAALALATGSPDPASAAETFLFETLGDITIPASGTSGPAAPFPSVVTVSGLTGVQRVNRVRVFLGTLNHSFPRDLDVILVAPTGEAVVLMADAGGFTPVNALLRFDDCALSSMPGDSLPDGAYRPTNLGQASNPTILTTGHTLSSFIGRQGSALNGAWGLWVVDDAGGDVGTIEAGWGLLVTVDTPGLPATQLSCGPDFDLDGIGDLVVGAGAGAGSHVQVLSGATGDPLLSFLAYPGLTGGVRVAACDFNGDGVPDIVTAAGPGGGPHVRVFGGTNGTPLSGGLGDGFFPYDPGFTGGAFVGCADMNADGVPDIIVAPGAGGGPHVRVYDGRTAQPMAGILGNGIFPFDPTFTGGVFVGP